MTVLEFNHDERVICTVMRIDHAPEGRPFD